MDKLTEAINAYNSHLADCRHRGANHAETCWGGADLMRKIEREAKALASVQ